MKKLNLIIKIILIVIAITLVFISCEENRLPQSHLVNSAHLDYLCEEISIDNKNMSIVHIYADYPDYKWLDDPDEGTACVDDAARAAVFFIRDYKYNNNVTSLNRAKGLIEFVLYMQSESGYFYNFIFPDHSINEEHKNSINRPGWWTWRALWALTEAYPILDNNNDQLAGRCLSAIRKTVNAIKEYSVTEKKTEVIGGFELPSWLPYNYASDQAALLIICLSNYYNITDDNTILDYINRLADGIRMMQINDKESEFYGAFLSWKNIWHGWGNVQSYSLLKAYQTSNNPDHLESALTEINNFYQKLYRRKYLNQFEVLKEGDSITTASIFPYSQIAYSFRPMVYSALEAYKITKDEKYALYAAKFAEWFWGDNHLNEQMYFPETGICFDGLNKDSVNRNSGAESTIEALLLLQEIERNDIAFSHLNKMIKSNEQ